LIRDRSLRLAGGLAIVVAIPVAVLFFPVQIDRRPRTLFRRRPASAEPGNGDGVTRKIEATQGAPYITVLLRTPQARPTR
jgi:hypothetical protein